MLIFTSTFIYISYSPGEPHPPPLTGTPSPGSLEPAPAEPEDEVQMDGRPGGMAMMKRRPP